MTDKLNLITDSESEAYAQCCAQRNAARAEIARLREALKPMTKGLYWLTHKDVDRARKALGE